MPDDLSPAARELHQRLIRNHKTVPREREERAPLYDTMCARLALGTAARHLGAAVDTLAPGKRGCPYHLHHAEEEMFVVLEGNGSLRVAGEMLPIVAGDVIFIPPGPEYPHQIVNTSDAPLSYLSIGMRASPEVVEYPDSAKYLVSATLEGQRGRFSHLHRPEGEDMDYWDGEP